MRVKYRTRQREELTEYLQSIKGRHFTVADVCMYFRNRGTAMGTATVYRQLDQMISEGLVVKYLIDENSSACFEYVGEKDHHHPSCYHCKCERCGKLIHMECHEIEALEKHISEHHGFRIDPKRTVFYGLCADCRKALEEEEEESGAEVPCGDTGAQAGTGETGGHE